MRRKVYVEVRARFDCDGGIRPLSMLWEDGMYYAVDRVLHVQPAAARKVGPARDYATNASSMAGEPTCIWRKIAGLSETDRTPSGAV